MRRQKKFYAWGYADEDLTPEEIKPWEAEIAQRYGLNGFDVNAAAQAGGDHAAQHRAWPCPMALKDIVRTDHLTRLEHSYGKAGFDTTRMFMRQVPNPPDAVAFPENEQDVVRLLDWCDKIGAKAIPYGGGSSVVKGIEPSAAFDKVVTISTRHMDKVLEVDAVSHAARIQGGIYGPAIEDAAARHARSPCATTCRPIAARPWAAGSPRARAATTPRSTPTSTTSSKARAW